MFLFPAFRAGRVSFLKWSLCSLNTVDLVANLETCCSSYFELHSEDAIHGKWDFAN